MRLQILAVPFDPGRRDIRMGKGPARLLERGFEAVWTRRGHDVATEWIEVSPAGACGAGEKPGFHFGGLGRHRDRPRPCTPFLLSLSTAERMPMFRMNAIVRVGFVIAVLTASSNTASDGQTAAGQPTPDSLVRMLASPDWRVRSDAIARLGLVPSHRLPSAY